MGGAGKPERFPGWCIPVAAIISADDLARLVLLEREHEERFAVIDRMRETFKDVPPEEIEREAERSVAEARACPAAPL